MKQHVCLAVAIVMLIAGCKKSTTHMAPEVTTTGASSVTSTSAQVGGTITNNGGSSVTQSGVCWAFTNNPTVSDSLITSGVPSGAFSVTMSALNPHTTYYFRAYAINGTGTGYGTVDSFLTASGVPTVTTAAITNNQALKAQSGGSVTNDGGAAITVKGVCWATSANPTVSASKTIDSPGTGSFVDTLTNLTIGVTYYVRAYATNSFGTGYGNQISFTASSTSTVADVDGNVYGTITIGTQIWTTSNLRVSHYTNGDPIQNALTGYNWPVADTVGGVGVFTYPNGDTTNNLMYGKYYNSFAVDDPRGIAPAGWHVATDQDWYTLEFFEGLTSSDTASNPGDNGLRGTIGGNLLVGGSSGLNLQLAGYAVGDQADGDYQGFGQLGAYWTSTSTGAGSLNNWIRAFNISGPGPIYRTPLAGSALSVRCVKN
jgi:uncharacterized protein (TIGR02145 family)